MLAVCFEWGKKGENTNNSEVTIGRIGAFYFLFSPGGPPMDLCQMIFNLDDRVCEWAS